MAGPSSSELFSSFRNLQPEDLVVVELCAGTAILSHTAELKGFRILAVDNNPRRSPGKHVLRIDLADPVAVTGLLDIIKAERDRLALLFISPPCGTASLARERKLLKWARKGFKIPAPLRSRLFPDMLPALKGWGKAKVELANQLYAQVTRIAIFAISLKILVVIENPAGSLYWLTSFFLELADFCLGHNVDFHSCCHGGQRPKLTRSWVSQKVFTQLSLFCDNTHWHKPWAPRRVGNRLHFVTADEAAYPLLLCQRTIDALLELCFPHLEVSSEQPSVIPFDSKATRVALGVQPRGKPMGPLVAEFAHPVAFVCEARKQVGIDKFLRSLPKGSKVLRRRLLNGGEVIPSLVHSAEVTFHDMPDLRSCDRCTLEQWKDSQLEAFFVGIPCSAEVFIERAFQAGHPRGFETHMEPAVHDATHANFSGDAYSLAKLRIDFVKTWTQKAKSLQRDENSLHASLPPYLRKVLVERGFFFLASLWKLLDVLMLVLFRIYDKVSGFLAGCLCREIRSQK